MEIIYISAHSLNPISIRGGGGGGKNIIFRIFLKKVPMCAQLYNTALIKQISLFDTALVMTRSFNSKFKKIFVFEQLGGQNRHGKIPPPPQNY